MTRARKLNGRVTFVGAGPGDPGLLTVRAADALRTARFVLVDVDVPAAVTALVDQAAEVRPAVGDPGEVARTLVGQARNGLPVVRLVSGDPLSADALVAEAVAVARTGVPFDVVPGVPAEVGVPAYAGVPIGSTYTT